MFGEAAQVSPNPMSGLYFTGCKHLRNEVVDTLRGGTGSVVVRWSRWLPSVLVMLGAALLWFMIFAGTCRGGEVHGSGQAMARGSVDDVNQGSGPDTPAVSVDPEHPGWAVPTTAGLRLRTEPGTDGAVLLTMRPDTWIRVTACSTVPSGGNNANASWCRVNVTPVQSGWVDSSYLSFKTDEEYREHFRVSRVKSPFIGRETPVDTTTIPRLLSERGYVPSPTFKAYVVAIERKPDGAIVYHRFDYDGTSVDRDNWWPASSVKLFAAVAALEYLRSMNFSSKAELTFHYEGKDVTNSVEWLVKQAITPSNNTAFDRLVEFVGLERMKAWFVRSGIPDTVLLRAYSGRVRDVETGFGTFRDTPAVTICEGKRPCKKLKAQKGQDKPWTCPNQGNCSTLQDLTEVLRRVMLHEDLPESERFDLGKGELTLLRGALSGKRARGLGVVNGIRDGFGSVQIQTFSKPGFAYQWFSDHVYVKCPSCTGPVREWLVAMAGHGGRDVLDEGARHIGALMAAGAFGPPIEDAGGSR